MSPLHYYLMHVGSAFLLTALTFQAFAAPEPGRRKRTMMLTGILSVLVLVGGFGLKAKLGHTGWPGWLIVKIVCWLVLSGLAGAAFRRPRSAGLLGLIGIVAVLTAVYMVYARPALPF